jgi:peptide/nickel transport system permease protein
MSILKKYLSAFHWSIFILFMYVMVALFAPIIANQYPLACKTEKGWLFPAIFSQDRHIHKANSFIDTDCIMPLIPFSPQVTDINNGASLSPGQTTHIKHEKHWLGTDKLGRDVAAGIIYGTKTAIQIGFISVFFSFIIGVALGMIAAYMQDGFRLDLLQIFTLGVTLFVLIFYFIFEWKFEQLNIWNFLLYSVGFLGINMVSSRISNLFSSTKKYKLNLDIILVKAIEIRKSFPGIFILLALASLFVIPSVWNIVFIITLLGWTEFARFARSETLAVKNENYITAAKVLGFSHVRILFKHILPNILSSLIVIACFSVGSAIILESTLSFLGVGLPLEQVTWGKMMAEGRDMQLWWLVLFPGLALFVIILCLNTIADVMTGKQGKAN